MSEFEDDEVWPICTWPKCDEEVNPRRWALGYRTCLFHGSATKTYTVAPPYNKGADQLISPSDIKYIGKK